MNSQSQEMTEKELKVLAEDSHGLMRIVAQAGSDNLGLQVRQNALDEWVFALPCEYRVIEPLHPREKAVKGNRLTGAQFFRLMRLEKKPVPVRRGPQPNGAYESGEIPEFVEEPSYTLWHRAAGHVRIRPEGTLFPFSARSVQVFSEDIVFAAKAVVYFDASHGKLNVHEMPFALRDMEHVLFVPAAGENSHPKLDLLEFDGRSGDRLVALWQIDLGTGETTARYRAS